MYGEIAVGAVTAGSWVTWTLPRAVHQIQQDAVNLRGQYSGRLCRNAEIPLQEHSDGNVRRCDVRVWVVSSRRTNVGGRVGWPVGPHQIIAEFQDWNPRNEDRDARDGAGMAALNPKRRSGALVSHQGSPSPVPVAHARARDLRRHGEASSARSPPSRACVLVLVLSSPSPPGHLALSALSRSTTHGALRRAVGHGAVAPVTAGTFASHVGDPSVGGATVAMRACAPSQPPASEQARARHGAGGTDMARTHGRADAVRYAARRSRASGRRQTQANAGRRSNWAN